MSFASLAKASFHRDPINLSQGNLVAQAFQPVLKGLNLGEINLIFFIKSILEN
jgi:hypothetical protein